jgi:hypothetical protein
LGRWREARTTARQEQDEALLQQVALLNLSCLEEPVLALHYAETLLRLPGVSDA